MIPAPSTIPEWRRNAPPGQSLAVVQRAAAPVPMLGMRTAGGLPMGRILRPQAMSRWLMPALASITPSYIEMVLRAALSGSHAEQFELFDLMEDTWPRLAKNLNELKRAVVGMDWQLKAWAEEDMPPSESAEDRMRLVSSAVWGMRPATGADECGFEETIYNLLDAHAKGVSVMELEWEQRDAGKLGTISAPRCTHWVHPVHYGWDSQGVLGLASGTGRNTTVTPLPEHKFLVALSKAKSGHPLGGALLRPLAWWWCAQNFSADWLLNFAQLFGMPIRIGTYAPNAAPDVIASINDMLENMGSAAWGSFPAGTAIEIKEPAKSGADSPQSDVMDRADTQCDLLILGQTLTSEMDASGGSFAAAKVHQGVRGDVIQSAANNVARVLNEQLIPAILALNHGDEEDMPEFCPEPKRIEDAKANAERDQMLISAGIKMPKAWLYKRHGIPLPQPDEELIGMAPPQPGFGFGAPMGREPVEPMEASQGRTVVIHARTAQQKLTDDVLEGLTGVEARWLGGVRPYFERLIASAVSGHLSDEQFEQVLVRAQAQMPELFDRLNSRELAKALEAAMGAAMVNGAVAASMRQRRAA